MEMVWLILNLFIAVKEWFTRKGLYVAIHININKNELTILKADAAR